MSFPIGSLWVKEAKKDGKTYMSGVINHLGEDIPVVAFANKNKTKANQPDYILYRSEPRDEEDDGGVRSVRPQSVENELPPLEDEPVPSVQVDDGGNINPEDLPF
jgi:glycosidase